jgi:hypothetical protein
MKKIITQTFLVGLLFMSVHAFSQSSNEKFLASTSHPVTVMASQGGIQASYMQGNMGTTPAISLVFQNKLHSAREFSWVVKNNSGAVIYTSPTVSLAAEQSLYEDNKPANSNLKFIYTLNNSMVATDYKVEITIVQ